MSRLKGKDGNGGNPGRVLVIFVLAGCAGYTIYNAGIDAGLKQVGYGGSILLNQAEPMAIARTETQGKDTFLENHNVYLPNVLGIPAGEAKPLPSIRIEDPNEDALRTAGSTKYGGQGDKAHLGGFTLYDGFGVSPATWNDMMQYVGVKSIMDVGCGKGLSTLYFLEHGADVLCLEGSHDAVTQTYLPDPATQVVEHDFSRCPYWPAKTYDAVWSVEFLEHVRDILLGRKRKQTQIILPMTSHYRCFLVC
jgi:Methyltransferase domain